MIWNDGQLLADVSPREAAALNPDDAVLWGLTPRELHDAYWAAHGVQVVRRGERFTRQRGVDLYLLLEPDQLVRFDVLDLGGHLAWRAAAVTRLRVVLRHSAPYNERAELDAEGRVRRVERRYGAITRAAQRVMLTPRAGFASIWSRGESRRDSWRLIRADAGLSNVDYFHCDGDCHDAGNLEDACAFVDALVRNWDDPERAIEGLERSDEGLVAPAGARLSSDVRVIGPVWLGAGRSIEQRACLVGPTWWNDEPGSIPEVSVRPISAIEPARATLSDVTPAGSRMAYQCAKRTFDVVASALGLLVLSPVLLLIALAVMIDDGWPVFFGHRRQTRGGRSFHCWKFRTMRRDADAIKARLQQENVCDGPQFFMADDPRVTRVGRILRKCQLDELPQLWNVLVGHMSLVGPRPSPDAENRICPSWREIRLSVRPGITGLWQLRRTREPGVDFQEWIRFDTEYVENAGFLYDLRILIQTVWMLLPTGSDDARDEAG